MQTNCPKCSQQLVVEDDKIPAGPFMLRCPKCQTSLKLPGKGTSAAPPGAPAPAPQSEAGSPSKAPAAPPPKPSAPTAAPPKPSAPPSMPSPSQGSAAHAEAAASAENGRALVFLSDASAAALQQPISTLLQGCGYGIDTTSSAQEGVHFLERASYALVVTTANGNSGGAGEVSLYKRVVALAPEIRRNLFLVLLGTEFSSGDGTQAFAAMADLVLNPKDLPNAADLLRSTVNERTRLFQAFQEAQVRLDRRKY